MILLAVIYDLTNGTAQQDEIIHVQHQANYSYTTFISEQALIWLAHTVRSASSRVPAISPLLMGKREK